MMRPGEKKSAENCLLLTVVVALSFADRIYPAFDLSYFDGLIAIFQRPKWYAYDQDANSIVAGGFCLLQFHLVFFSSRAFFDFCKFSARQPGIIVADVWCGSYLGRSWGAGPNTDQNPRNGNPSHLQSSDTRPSIIARHASDGNSIRQGLAS